jgi:putative ABC transport system substrate-binding protein
MRRLFFSLALVLVSATSSGQTVDKVYRLGFLSPPGINDTVLGVTLPELARLGFAEGRNMKLEVRTGPIEQLPALARELLIAKPDVIIAVGGAPIRAIRAASNTVPIVGSFIGEDPVAAGFAVSLARPGGNVTGIEMLAPELDGKRLELLHEAVPSARRVAALAVSAARDEANIAAMRRVAAAIDVELLEFYADASADYPGTFAAMRSKSATALAIISAPELFANAPKLAGLAVDTGLPTVCEWRAMAEQGCLLGYGPSITALLHRTADYVVRIFRGAAPGELPIEEPTIYEFGVNLKTAKALGLTIPPAVLVRADVVIE